MFFCVGVLFSISHSENHCSLFLFTSASYRVEDDHMYALEISRCLGNFLVPFQRHSNKLPASTIIMVNGSILESSISEKYFAGRIALIISRRISPRLFLYAENDA